MCSKEVFGKINSIQSLGTLDGPGVRFVVFTQGCNLRCGCCHNPDTWDTNGGKDISASEIFSKVLSYREYFGKDGGITVSGGEPLLQPEFVREIFTLCKGAGINTCLDTSGSILNDKIKELLKVTDKVLLDIKYTSEEMYQKYVGCSLSSPLTFLQYLDSHNIPTVIRQVIIPKLNDNEENIKKLKELKDTYSCVEKIELLPFKKICKAKYDNLNLKFPFEKFDTPDKNLMESLSQLLQ